MIYSAKIVSNSANMTRIYIPALDEYVTLTPEQAEGLSLDDKFSVDILYFSGVFKVVSVIKEASFLQSFPANILPWKAPEKKDNVVFVDFTTKRRRK